MTAKQSCYKCKITPFFALIRLDSNLYRPLLVVGKGAAYSQADTQLQELAQKSGIPVLATAMGRGVVPDSNPLNVNAARSLALAKADVAIVFGARYIVLSPSYLFLTSRPFLLQVLPPQLQ